jgi:hypothetical protein
VPPEPPPAPFPEPTEVAQPLADLQRLFAAALNEPTRRAGLLALCRGDAAILSRRFELYRDHLRASWEKALAAAYPVVQRYVGEAFFLEMSGLYGVQCPSHSGDLNRFGAELPLFLERFAPLSDHPWLPDLARLEWAVHASHFAADAAALAAHAVARMSEDALDRWDVALHPTCALIRSPWDVGALWRWHQVPEPGPWCDDVQRPAATLVCRPRWKVGVRALHAGEAAGLACVAAGARLGDALHAACTAEPEMDVAAVFAGWLRDGLLVEPVPAPAGAPDVHDSRLWNPR